MAGGGVSGVEVVTVASEDRYETIKGSKLSSAFFFLFEGLDRFEKTTHLCRLFKSKSGKEIKRKE